MDPLSIVHIAKRIMDPADLADRDFVLNEHIFQYIEYTIGTEYNGLENRAKWNYPYILREKREIFCRLRAKIEMI